MRIADSQAGSAVDVDALCTTMPNTPANAAAEHQRHSVMHSVGWAIQYIVQRRGFVLSRAL